jgi:hypothetical protein
MTIGEGEQYVAQMSASNDRGNALNNMGGRCQMNRLIDTVAKTVEAYGYCSYTDLITIRSLRSAILPGKPHTCELTGGTGKFQGQQSSIITTSMPVKITYEGTLQIGAIRTERKS